MRFFHDVDDDTLIVEEDGEQYRFALEGTTAVKTMKGIISTQKSVGGVMADRYFETSMPQDLPNETIKEIHVYDS